MFRDDNKDGTGIKLPICQQEWGNLHITICHSYNFKVCACLPIMPCIYSINEVNIWQTAPNAVLDAANSSLLSFFPNGCARGQSMIWNAACLGLVSAEAQM